MPLRGSLQLSFVVVRKAVVQRFVEHTIVISRAKLDNVGAATNFRESR